MSLAEALIWSLVGGFASPGVFLPAIIMGWLARTGWQAALGGAAVAVALFLFGQVFADLPEGAEVLWVAAPLGLIPPMLWSLAAYALAGWMRRRTRRDPSDAGIRALEAAIGAMVGAVLGGGVAIAAGILFVELAEVSNFEGAAGYLVFLGFGVPGGLLGLVAGAVIGWRRRRRRAGPAT